MSDFSIHSEDNHPEHAAEVIGAVREKYGFVPNLLGALSESPAAVQAYLSLGEALRESSFTPEERHVVWFTINALHECRYCMAAHTGIARSEKISEQVIETARAGTDYADPKLQALKVFTTRMVLTRLGRKDRHRCVSGCGLHAAHGFRRDPGHLAQGALELHQPCR